MAAVSYSFEHELERAWPMHLWRDCHVLLAVSGGADSVALLRAAVNVKERTGGSGQLFVGHLNHKLRGDESDLDQKWLDELCRALGVPLEAGIADVAELAAQKGNGVEAAAREARYEFLLQTAQRLGARYVVTAHTADDQVETVLHHILRGTGLAGLAGIPEVRPLSPAVTLVRPLLEATRQDVLEYLESIGQAYRVDPTNCDPRWTRNRLRHDLLPLLREHYNAEIGTSIARLATQAGEAQQVLESIANELAEPCVGVEFASEKTDAGGAVRARIDRSALEGHPPIIVREVCKAAWRAAGWPLQAMGFHQWQQLASIVLGQLEPEGVNFPANVRVSRSGDVVTLMKHGPA